MSNPKMDKSLAKYQNNPQAYDLRIIEDEDSFKPDMDFPPLDKNKLIKDIDFDVIALIEVAKFK